MRHHVVTQQKIRQAHGDVNDERNLIWIGAPFGACMCHDDHHHPGVADRRIPLASVPPSAIAFARELLGDGPAEVYLRRRYR